MQINDLDLDELKKLHAAATQGDWESTTYSNYAGWSVWAPNGSGCIAERWYPVGTEDEIPRNDLWIAASHNAFPALIKRLEAAEAERDERVTMAARAQEALRYVLNGLPATDAVWAAYGNADSARAWLTARDARMKREGAAEWLENAAREGGYYERSSEGMLEEAKWLREEN